MKLPAAVFREYDIRGTVGDQLTPQGARAIGQAVATLAWERLRRAPRLAVGRDNRPSGPALAEAVLSGIEAVGGHAVDVGELPTPALYFATHVLDVDGGVQVTGSHNPPAFNGFKVVLGGDAVALFCESDGTFPNHHPDPTVPENLRDLQAAVAREVPELGIAFDGDGDRIGAVDEGGRVVFGDQLLVLLGRDLARRLGPGHAVIFDVKCSEVLPQELARVGLTPTMWKTGHSLIKQKMKEVGAPLAGEMSGHMFFGGDWYGFDDALFAAARLLRYVAEQGGPLSRLLADLPATVSTPELRVDCPDELKFAIAARAAAHFAAKYPVSTLDGVRISFRDGWGLLRASNTQPVLVLRFEASTPGALAAHRAEVEGWLATQGIGS